MLREPAISMDSGANMSPRSMTRSTSPFAFLSRGGRQEVARGSSTSPLSSPRGSRMLRPTSASAGSLFNRSPVKPGGLLSARVSSPTQRPSPASGRASAEPPHSTRLGGSLFDKMRLSGERSLFQASRSPAAQGHSSLLRRPASASTSGSVSPNRLGGSFFGEKMARGGQSLTSTSLLRSSPSPMQRGRGRSPSPSRPRVSIFDRVRAPGGASVDEEAPRLFDRSLRSSDNELSLAGRNSPNNNTTPRKTPASSLFSSRDRPLGQELSKPSVSSIFKRGSPESALTAGWRQPSKLHNPGPASFATGLAHSAAQPGGDRMSSGVFGEGTNSNASGLSHQPASTSPLFSKWGDTSRPLTAGATPKSSLLLSSTTPHPKRQPSPVQASLQQPSPPRPSSSPSRWRAPAASSSSFAGAQSSTSLGTARQLIGRSLNEWPNGSKVLSSNGAVAGDPPRKSYFGSGAGTAAPLGQAGSDKLGTRLGASLFQTTSLSKGGGEQPNGSSLGGLTSGGIKPGARDPLASRASGLTAGDSASGARALGVTWDLNRSHPPRSSLNLGSKGAGITGSSTLKSALKPQSRGPALGSSLFSSGYAGTAMGAGSKSLVLGASSRTPGHNHTNSISDEFKQLDANFKNHKSEEERTASLVAHLQAQLQEALEQHATARKQAQQAQQMIYEVENRLHRR